jgi:hypothetical protein
MVVAMGDAFSSRSGGQLAIRGKGKGEYCNIEGRRRCSSAECGRERDHEGAKGKGSRGGGGWGPKVEVRPG